MSADETPGESDTLGPDEPISLEKRRRRPKAPDMMSVEQVREAADEVTVEAYNTAGSAFTADALEAAAVLKMRDAPAYANLKAALKESPVNLNDWTREVKQVELDLKSKLRRADDPRPVIVETADLHTVVEECTEALMRHGSIYQRRGELVEVLELDDAEVRPVHTEKLAVILSKTSRFERPTQDGNKAIQPPKRAVAALHKMGDWGIRRFQGFVDGACMLPDGEILCTEGYHPHAEMFVRNAVPVTGVRSPDQDDAREAYQTLVDLLADFEFADDRDAHIASVIAAALTIVARPAINGPTPMHLFDANRPRTGKSLLAKIVCLMATGTDCSPRAFPSGRSSDDEVRKQITSIARSGRPVVVFDNVKGTLGGPSLELALTTDRWSDRQLGDNIEVDEKLHVTWLSTSNNAQLTPDMHGRVLVARLETRRESPEQRGGWTFPNITRHVRKNRTRYLSALLTILRAWHVAGRPEFDLTPWGSFEEWSHVVRNAIVHAGGADPHNARTCLEDADPETSALRSVLANWPEGQSFHSSDLSEAMKEGRIKSDFGQPSHADFCHALDELVSTTSPRGISRRLGIYRHRVVGGRRLVSELDTARNVKVWKVEILDD